MEPESPQPQIALSYETVARGSWIARRGVLLILAAITLFFIRGAAYLGCDVFLELRFYTPGRPRFQLKPELFRLTYWKVLFWPILINTTACVMAIGLLMASISGSIRRARWGALYGAIVSLSLGTLLVGYTIFIWVSMHRLYWSISGPAIWSIGLVKSLVDPVLASLLLGAAIRLWPMMRRRYPLGS
jgi:hypothetical protein